MPETPKLRKWHFLFLGCALILLAAFLLYCNWRDLGLPTPLRPEHWIAVAAFVLGFLVLGVFVYRLTRRQVTIMLVGLVIVNALALLGSTWIHRSYTAIVNLFASWAAIDVVDAAYMDQWRDLLLTPVIYALHAGLILLWGESLVMFLIRKPEDRPD